MTTINPGFVVGPAFYDNDSTSGLFMRRILTNDMPGIPDLAFGTVDVRDVAAAHIFAVEKPNTDGKRYILVEGTHHWKEMINILKS
jgi:dihydroflavonol-4-reductase